jgi:hypothetical protein
MDSEKEGRMEKYRKRKERKGRQTRERLTEAFWVIVNHKENWTWLLMSLSVKILHQKSPTCLGMGLS